MASPQNMALCARRIVLGERYRAGRSYYPHRLKIVYRPSEGSVFHRRLVRIDEVI
jgi:hypothetical protein